MSRKRTRFVVAERRLIVGNLPKGRDPSDVLLHLFDNHIIEQPHLWSNWRSQTLSFVLREHKGLPPINLLQRLAYYLSRDPRHRIVYDPWEIGGKPVDIELAVELIGNVFRSTTRFRMPFITRR